MNIAHITAGALGLERLVRDDRDRWDLLERARAALGTALLAWCVMDTHLHLVAEGGGSVLARKVDGALLAYARAFNRRHGRVGGLLRGPSVAVPVPGPFELGRAIRYVHENPVSAGLVADAIDWPWSSARAFAGLVRARRCGVERARALVDPRAARMLGAPVKLADARPLEAPEHAPAALLSAAAQSLSLDPSDLADARRGPDLALGRALYVRLGILEGYQRRQLASALGVTRQRISQLAATQVDPLDLRRARTLLELRLTAPLPGLSPQENPASVRRRERPGLSREESLAGRA